MAKGEVSPNPLVGSVIVKNGKIISKGHHRGSGQDHAELDAIKNANESLVGATIYANLEPCCHTNKRTPPCAQRIIKEGFKKVVISNLDPNPLVAGKGVKLLKDAGIEVITDVLKEEGERLNEVFFTHITQSRPFIHLKFAQTLDGKMSTTNGHSKWITSEESRKDVHEQRNLYDAILVGANTALKDNPKLTVRLNNRQKVVKRIILTKEKITNNTIDLLNDEHKEETIQCIIKSSSDLSSTMKKLYKEDGINSIYVEGGAKTIDMFLENNLFDKVSVYIAPKILGKGKSLLQGQELNEVSNSYSFKDVNWQIIKDNIVMTAYRKN